MARFVTDNPTNSRALTLTPASIVISSTSTDGLVNTATSVAALVKGQSVILTFSGGTAQGFTTNEEYFVIPVGDTSFKLASTKANAQNGTSIETTGDAGAGVVYPVFPVGGVLYIGTGGNVNMRGVGVRDTGATSFSLHKNIFDGASYPYMIKDICTLNTTASDIVVWSD